MKQAYASSTGAVDHVFWFIAGISALVLLVVTALMIVFAVRYHHRRQPAPRPVRESAWLEICWTLIPTVLMLAMFWYGYRTFLTMRAVPPDALVVKVTGMMWQWRFEYPNAKKTSVLYVPLHKPVKLELASADVIHSFYVPAFRLKEDVVPGKSNYLWFKPEGMGAATVFCSQYCGLQHAYMISRVEVMSEADFTSWYNGPDAAPAEEAAVTDVAAPGQAEVARLPGVKLMEADGCLVCHPVNGEAGMGPDLRGVFGRRTTVMEAGRGRDLVADEAYLRRALLEPGREIVQGYEDVMPPATGLSEEDLQTILETLRELR